MSIRPQAGDPAPTPEPGIERTASIPDPRTAVPDYPAPDASLEEACLAPFEATETVEFDAPRTPNVAFALIATLLCPPLGIIALIRIHQANKAIVRGDAEVAFRRAASARVMSVLGSCFGGLVLLILLPLLAILGIGFIAVPGLLTGQSIVTVEEEYPGQVRRITLEGRVSGRGQAFITNVDGSEDERRFEGEFRQSLDISSAQSVDVTILGNNLADSELTTCRITDAEGTVLIENSGMGALCVLFMESPSP